MANRVSNIFNDSSLEKRAHLLCTYGQYLDYIFEPGYAFHFYALGNNIVLTQYSTDQELIVDIWMLEYKEFDNFIGCINIDDVWERVRK